MDERDGMIHPIWLDYPSLDYRELKADLWLLEAQGLLIVYDLYFGHKALWGLLHIVGDGGMDARTAE